MTETSTSLSCLTGYNAAFLADLYRAFLQDPKSVDPSWRPFFDQFHDDGGLLKHEQEGPSWGRFLTLPRTQTSIAPASANDASLKAYAQTSMSALMLIRAYRSRGHMQANLDPLGLASPQNHPELDPTTYGFTEQDYNREIYLGGALGFESASLNALIERLKRIYSRTIGVEYLHIQDPDQKAWIQNHIDNLEERYAFTQEEKLELLKGLIKADRFETFLHVKFPGAKRFGLDGGESMLPALDAIISRVCDQGIQTVILGMAHRGRLNVLANIIGKPLSLIFQEFKEEIHKMDGAPIAGDVKYHCGYANAQTYGGHEAFLSMLSNPSHVESINPVAAGHVRALQTFDKESSTIGILIHGDTAITGQGSVFETLCLAELPGYRVGGIIHLIINNQIGFTTSPRDARSSTYCSDVAKIIQAPIFHVNGEDPEAVLYVARLAADFRQQFHKDAFIDLVCYRRYGHNEMDEPAFTQPVMYQAIKQKTSLRQMYQQTLIEAGVISEAEASAMIHSYERRLTEEFDKKPSLTHISSKKPTKSRISEISDNLDTGVDRALLKKIGQSLTLIPEGFKLHPRLLRLLTEREPRFAEGKALDWGMAEALAFGSLLCDGHPMRLSGEDSGRGTFSQRHAVYIDQNTGERYIPLNHIQSQQASIEIVDSPLSEAGVMGFEYGYSLAAPQALTLWEAQYGDFANGAQVYIDQYVASGEAKWGVSSGLVLLLPHGYEGQGSEHSSARLERCLQLSADDNWRVANCTTPANYFHILRRQVHQKLRKPLVIMTPKSLLRHPLATSTLMEMGAKTYFQPVLPDGDAPTSVKRVILCSGKVYYDLVQERSKSKRHSIALVRVEQLFPFPSKELGHALKRYPKADIAWCQEEPKNMGAWSYIAPILEEMLVDMRHASTRVQYAGRAASSAPATGYHEVHSIEQRELIKEALG